MFIGCEKVIDVIIIMKVFIYDVVYWVLIYYKIVVVLRGFYSGVIYYIWIVF